MELLASIATKLHDQVKARFEQDIKERGIEVPKTENAFWNVRYDHKSLFKELIGDLEPLFLRDKTKYKEERMYEVSKRKVMNFGKPETLAAFLDYLGYQGEVLSDKLNAFLETVEEEERQFQQKHLNRGSNRRRESARPREDIKDLLEDTAKLLSKRYAPHLLGKKFWLFFYGYDKFKGIPGKEKDTWPLVKLLFKFTQMSGNDIEVELDNNGDPEHHDYLGKTDFLTSRDEVLVINCRTFPGFSRQLNIKVNIGTGTGDVFLGQYMNYESEGRIISGSLLFQRIPDDEIDLTPCVHRVPRLQAGVKMYDEDFDGVDKSILQYMHDKKLNFRRTSLRAGHSLESLENWLKYHHDED